MGSAADEGSDDGVEFTYEGGIVTARDLETGIASCGESKAEALAMLAEALLLHEGGGETVDEEAAVLEEIGLDPEEIERARELNDGPPEFTH